MGQRPTSKETGSLSTWAAKFISELNRCNIHSPVSSQLSGYYKDENDLRRKFASKCVVDPHQNLIPVFHPEVIYMDPWKIKASLSEETSSRDKYLFRLSHERRIPHGQGCLVQGSLPWFQRNWDIFTGGVLQYIKWHVLWSRGR